MPILGDPIKNEIKRKEELKEVVEIFHSEKYGKTIARTARRHRKK